MKKPLKAITDLQAWAKTHDMQQAPGYTEIMSDLVSKLEALPVVASHIKHPMGFVLVAGKWESVNVLNELPLGWAEWRADFPNGDSESGLARPFGWAHANMDNQPSILLEDLIGSIGAANAVS